MESRPYEGGMELNQVIVLDIAGYIPNFVKTIIAKRLSNIGLKLVDYIMHGVVPPSLFWLKNKLKGKSKGFRSLGINCGYKYYI